MASGGHARSGPAPDPRSGTSARRGLQFESLPSGGYAGLIPDFPLTPMIVMQVQEGKRRYQTPDAAATEAFADRELALWRVIWRTPQADAWARRPWMIEQVAHFARVSVICEGPEARAADRTSMRQLRDDIGLSVAGLRAMQWQIATDSEEPAARKAQRRPGARERFGVINGGASEEG